MLNFFNRERGLVSAYAELEKEAKRMARREFKSRLTVDRKINLARGMLHYSMPLPRLILV